MKRYGLLLFPLGIGILLAWFLQAGLLTNSILYLRADAGTFLFVIGLAVSVMFAAALFWATWSTDRYERALKHLRWQQTDSHRRFIRRLDHELKNPLTAMRAGLANVNDSNGAALSSVRTQVDRLARLSTDLRKLADMERLPLEREAVDVNQLLRELVEAARERAEPAARRVRLNVQQAPWPLPAVEGDRDLLLLALYNLIDNAVKFARPTDTIEVRAFEDGNSIVVEVADTGPGVEEEELSHLGEELYRGSRAMNVEGSGLGLALVQAIVARHAGTMAIRSRAGQGTVVTLRLAAAR